MSSPIMVKTKILGQAWWYMLVIPAVGGREMGRGQHGQDSVLKKQAGYGGTHFNLSYMGG
jgi:hypothetical protein